MPPQSALPIRGKTNKQTKTSPKLTLYEAYTNHWTQLRRAEIKRKKEVNFLQGKNSTFLEVLVKETSKTVSQTKKKKKERKKSEKYYTNERKK